MSAHRPFSALEIKNRELLAAYLDQASEDDIIGEVLLPLMHRDHFVRIGKICSLRKTEAAKRNGSRETAGRPRVPCPKCGSEDKVLRREGSRVGRVCRNCLFIRANPSELTSTWRIWYPEKWQAWSIDRRPLGAWPIDEIREKQRKYWGNSAADQGALDAALLAASASLPTGKLNLKSVTAWWPGR